MIKEIEVILKIAKNTFLSSLFQHLKMAWKKRVFCDFKDHFHLFDHQTTLKNIAWILYNFCIFGIWKNPVNSSKSENKWEYFRGHFLIRWDNVTTVNGINCLYQNFLHSGTKPQKWSPIIQTMIAQKKYTLQIWAETMNAAY